MTPAEHPLIWTPPNDASEPILRRRSAPRYDRAHPLKVLTWNLQYFAGRGYVFFYDYLAWDGPDSRPSRVAIERSLDGVARAILDEAPDVLLLQELDDGAARTGGEDQLSRLWDRVEALYPIATQAFYWRSRYVPHPKIRGSAGMKLAILSRFELDFARRVQLSLIPGSRLKQAFGMKRAILFASVACTDGRELVVGSTHFDAFAQGTDTMQRQVAEVSRELARLDERGADWVLGGDFNLLATDGAFERLSPEQQLGYAPNSELLSLVQTYRSVPSPAQIDSPDGAAWHSYFHNDPSVEGPDRTLDYLFYSRGLTLETARVRQDAAVMPHSDHLPVIAAFRPG